MKNKYIRGFPKASLSGYTKYILGLVWLWTLGITQSTAQKKDIDLFGHDSHVSWQSPINIITKDVTEGQHQIDPTYRKSHEHIVHRENTIEVVYDEGSFLTFDSIQYSFKQFHFHTPSEHLIDGVTYPMEMHLVHKYRHERSNVSYYFVISVLFEMGESNVFLEDIIANIPEEIDETFEFGDKMFDISQLVVQELEDFYFYTGSLTTEPYTEMVRWAVSQHIMQASSDQIETLQTNEGNNARSIQMINGRRVEVIHH